MAPRNEGTTLVGRWRAVAPAAVAALAALAALALTLAGCGGHVEGALVPVATVPTASPVTLYVATTREPAAVLDAVDYSGERARDPSFAKITVSIPPDSARAPGTVQWPQRAPGDPEKDFTVAAAERLDRPQFAASLREAIAANPGRRVLVFVHGYNNRFDDAVFRFAQIVHDSHADVVPVLFTWPSRANLFAYGYDRESANYSRTTLETMLRTLADSPGVGEVDILAHSMGNWVTMEALRQMAIRDGRIAPKIRTVMLAAPDVDVDVFREQMLDIGTERPEMILFVSSDDKALAMSKRIWQSTDRLGAIDPNDPRYRGQIERAGLNVIDLSAVKAGDSFHHGKFAESPEVVRLIGGRLMEGQTLTDENVSAGDRIVALSTGVAAGVGTAVGVVASAPVAVIDSGTRRTIEHAVTTTAAGQSLSEN